ncbi:MAG: amidohydrolase [Steroidobacteraceae bacterium]|nr:amidohydrolase [Pseudomonadota bacterium]
MTANLRVTMIQADLAWQDPATNRRNLAAHFRGLAGHTDLIVLPEMFTTGFSMAASSLAETMAGATVGWLREEAAAIGCAITGSLIVEEGGRHYNRLVLATPDGGCAHYDKRHLFRMAREQEHYSSGNRRLVVEIKGWRLCPLVCYDLRFPVWSRNRGDYDVLLYVANWPSRRRSAWSALLRARAIENVCYVVGVNRVGKDGNGANYSGDSVALDFLGQVLAGDRDGVLVETVVLDRESLATFRRDFPAHLDADDFELRADTR